jgi:hypothetical protein
MSSFPIEENYIGFEVLTAVVMKSSIFWDISPCIPVHGITSQKIELFVTTTVRTSNPTKLQTIQITAFT